MSVDEKVTQLFYGEPPSTDPATLLQKSPHGFGGMSVGQLSPAQRNAIQTAYMTQTTRGIPVSFYGETLRSAGIPNCTIFAAPALLGCSWNTSLVEAVGRTVATELWARGGDRSFSPVLQVGGSVGRPLQRMTTSQSGCSTLVHGASCRLQSLMKDALNCQPLTPTHHPPCPPSPLPLPCWSVGRICVVSPYVVVMTMLRRLVHVHAMHASHK
jgi:hypothetical protein